MTATARKEIYTLALQHYGVDCQLNIAIEELSELMKEICKSKRGFDNRDNLVEELSDVYVMAEQLKMIFSIKDDEITDYMDFKLNRLENDIKKNNTGG